MVGGADRFEDEGRLGFAFGVGELVEEFGKVVGESDVDPSGWRLWLRFGVCAHVLTLPSSGVRLATVGNRPAIVLAGCGFANPIRRRRSETA